MPREGPPGLPLRERQRDEPPPVRFGSSPEHGLAALATNLGGLPAGPPTSARLDVAPAVPPSRRGSAGPLRPARSRPIGLARLGGSPPSGTRGPVPQRPCDRACGSPGRGTGKLAGVHWHEWRGRGWPSPSRPPPTGGAGTYAVPTARRPARGAAWEGSRQRAEERMSWWRSSQRVVLVDDEACGRGSASSQGRWGDDGRAPCSKRTRHPPPRCPRAADAATHAGLLRQRGWSERGGRPDSPGAVRSTPGDRRGPTAHAGTPGTPRTGPGGPIRARRSR